MGADRARRWERSAPDGPRAVLGVAGALADGIAPGDVVVADRVIDGTLPDADCGVALASASTIAAQLRRLGLTVHVGPVVSVERTATGDRRSALMATGALAVDMESAWLVDGGSTHAVVRVIVDTPDHELWRPSLPGRLLRARRTIGATVAPLEQWAAALGDREVILPSPRSFCAGVDRAIDVVHRALADRGAPVYVRRQVVHNTRVVAELADAGAVFVDELDEVPDGGTVVFAAHGVSPQVRAEAQRRDLPVIDATCPLVAKVHREARRFADEGLQILLIGHADHEEVEGTSAETPMTVIDPSVDVATIDVVDPDRVAYLTQTTLAVAEVDETVARLRDRFPAIVGPRADDICFATQNRQAAVIAIAPDCDLILVAGSANSSNSMRLAEVARREGVEAHLVDDPDDVDLTWLAGARVVGVTAGASAPESLVTDLVARLGSLGTVVITERAVVDETVRFPLPAEVR